MGDAARSHASGSTMLALISNQTGPGGVRSPCSASEASYWVWEASSPPNRLGESPWARCIHSRYLVDTDQEVEGLGVIADFQGAALDDEKVLQEYKEIRDAVLADVGHGFWGVSAHSQRAVGDRSYKALWRRYRARVMIAMSSQMFAQLVRLSISSTLPKKR
jgi:hypothetical protein